MTKPTNTQTCGICGDKIDNKIPLKSDCGGDCWECISEIEANMMGVDVKEYRLDPVGFIERASRKYSIGNP